jgi:predicted MPP superfamily phosphohydrolase
MPLRRKFQSLFNHTPRRRPRYLRQVHRLIHPPRRAQRVRDPEVSQYRLELPGLPPGLAGLRIVHLSDIHYSLYLSPAAVVRTVQLANSLRPDLVAITGDFVTTSPQFIEPVSDALARLRSRFGIYAVLGNHDFRAGAETLTLALRQRGIRVLRNSHEWLETNRGRIKIVGIDDSRQKPDLAAALGDASSEDFTLLLAHNPLALEDAAQAGVDLVLSGHTHGGQIKLRFAQPFYERFLPEGFQELGRTRMYISRGIGKVLVPMRIGCPPEIASFRLYPSRNGGH